MKTVYKYTLNIADRQTLLLPEEAVVLHVGLDPVGTLCLWAFVDTERPPRGRTFVVTGTGHPVPDGLEYLGSVMQNSFVWHVWEKIE